MVNWQGPWSKNKKKNRTTSLVDDAFTVGTVVDPANTDRGQYSDVQCFGISVEFILSAIGYAVGVGNVWRFPYKASENGGGVFLIPYFLMLFICGIPIFYLELFLGQYSGQGTITVWKCSPLFKGLGWAMVFVSSIVCIYYNIIIAWSLRYLAASFQNPLPWTRCDHDYSNQFKNLDCIYDAEYLNGWKPADRNNSITPAAEFWFYGVLRQDQSAGLEDIGAPLLDLTFCNFLAWLIVFCCLFKGVQSCGKVVYLTATFPYFVLIILFFLGITREGAMNGIYYYLVPDWNQLFTIKIWKEAATQIFFSLGVGFGGLMTMASFNKYNNNFSRDTLIVCLGNCLTSFFAGFVIFSVLGNMAHNLGIEDVKELSAGGPGLSFIAYPAALAMMPFPQVWSVLFFIMMVMLGLDSQYAYVEIIVTGLTDQWVGLRPFKPWLLLTVCLLGFLLGLPMTSPGGIYWLTLLDTQAASIGFLMVAFGLIVGIYLVYGNFATEKGRLNQNIRDMLGQIPSKYYPIMWSSITPLAILLIAISSCVGFKIKMGFGYKPGDYHYSTFGYILGLWINLMPIVIVVVFGFYVLKKYDFDWRKSIRPSADWKGQGQTFNRALRSSYRQRSIGSGRDLERRRTRSSFRTMSVAHESSSRRYTARWILRFSLDISS